MKTSLFVFRRDLRLSDNTALLSALAASDQIVALFVLDPVLIGRWQDADYRLAFLAAALRNLARELEAIGGSLLIESGDPAKVIPEVAKRFACQQVFVNRDYSTYARRRDRRVYEHCQSEEVQVQFLGDQLLQEPEHVHKADGSPYMIFTPFYKAASRLPVREIQGTPRQGVVQTCSWAETEMAISCLSSLPMEVLGVAALQPQVGRLADYVLSRDLPGQHDGTSRLSAYLRFGIVSPRQVYFWAGQLTEPESFRRQLYWRDFYHHIAWHFPHVFRGCFRAVYDKVAWLENDESFQAWCEGRTGIPIVDAGMRELAATGYMHNRVRMVVASFLTKNLQIGWRKGEEHFARYLIDFDPAVNNGNWQWSASTGCDAQPYFRVFNPWRQMKRFDPECVYIKEWVPELRNLSAGEIHRLEKDPTGYIQPIVDLKRSARESIARFKNVR